LEEQRHAKAPGMNADINPEGHPLFARRLSVNFPLNLPHPIDRDTARHYSCKAMPPADLDQLRLAYKQATDEWVATIRAEEALATPDHSMIAMEKWDAAHFLEHDAHMKATEAREAYKDALRAVNYGI
jgi:hypothetical protein